MPGPISRWGNAIKGTVWGIAGVALLAFAVVAMVFFMQWFSDPSGHIRIVEPNDRAVVGQSTVTIRGTSSPEWAGVYSVIEGLRQPVAVAENGDWRYAATLTEGQNVFKFHLGSHYGQSASVTIFYEPR